MNPDLVLWLFLALMGGYLALGALVYVTDVWPQRRRRDRQTRQIDAWLARRQAHESRQRF